MADAKISSLTAATSVAAADQLVIVQGGASKMATGAMVRGAPNSTSTATVSAGYAADTYLAGSAVTIPSISALVQVGTTYYCAFDMVKTAAGTATPIITFRWGTGVIGDSSIVVATFAAGTAAVDTGIFEVTCIFRSIGAGATAVQMMARCTHHLAATGLTSTGASGTAIILNGTTGLSLGSAVFGLSFNGGASFSGTNTMVVAAMAKL